MDDFLSLGFDLRVPLVEGVEISADATVWPQAESAYGRVLQSGFKENAFGLIDVEGHERLLHLRQVIAACEEAAELVELSAFEVAVRHCPLGFGFERRGDVGLVDEEFKVEAYDVCDLDGFFSVLGMGIGSLGMTRPFGRNELLSAAALSQGASFAVPSHAPFVIVRIRVIASPLKNA